MHKNIFSFPLYAIHALGAGQQPRQRFIVRLRRQLKRIFSFPLHLLSKLRDGAAGNQASFHENAYPVADLLYLVKLMGGQ